MRAEATVFEHFLGTRRIALDLRSAIPAMPVRHFATGEDLEREVADARIWGGLHFRFSTEVGGSLGRQVAEWAPARNFRQELDG